MKLFRPVRFLAGSIVFLTLASLSSAADMSITPSDIRLEAEYSGSGDGFSGMTGYHLYVRKKDGVHSVLLTETTRDPTGMLPNYAYRAKEWNEINGNELRILNGLELKYDESKYSIIDSTPQPDEQFGQAFHLYIPSQIDFGYPETRHGTVHIQQGTFVNIRTFEKPYADYTGNFADNPYIFDLIIPPEKPEDPVQETVHLLEPYSREAAKSFDEIASSTGGKMIYSKGPESIVNDLVEAIDSLGSPTSILNIKLSDAIVFRAALTSNNKLSVTSISERIYCLASFYDFIALSNNLMRENPFRIARVKSHTQYLNPTNPISHEELRTVLKNLSLMSTHIQIAILILCETGARANEVCGITINEFHIESNGTPVLTINLRKNRKARAQRGSPTFVRHEISHNLAVLISDYIARHEAERSAINTDCILVYTPSQLRQGTQRPPVVLSSDTLKYWLDKLAGPDIQCTPRQIRAAIGRAAFATGKNASEVAAKLGNTAQIAETHYNFMLPQEEAELYDKFYDTIFQFNRLTPSMSRESFGHKELYGTCSNPNCSISNKNRCESCSQRFTCNPIPKEGAYIVS